MKFLKVWLKLKREALNQKTAQEEEKSMDIKNKRGSIIGIVYKQTSRFKGQPIKNCSESIHTREEEFEEIS